MANPAPARKSLPNLRRIVPLAAALALFLGITVPPSLARAEETWSVGSGRVIFNFNVPLLQDLGIDLTVSGVPLPDQEDLRIQDPRWAFPILPGSDFKIRTEHGIALPGGSIGGALALDADITFRDRATGTISHLTDLEITQAPWPGSDALAGEDGPPIVLRSRSTGLAFCQLVSPMFDFRRKELALRVHYLNARVTREWADALGRPELAGWVIGMGEVRGGVSRLSSTPASSPAYKPVYTAGIKDVSLGALSSVQQAGHIGTIPTGTTALTMATTSCNLGTVDVPWLAPMNTDHPIIHMALYRLKNGRFEQIGVSWLKHGFFALSNSQCSTCQNPSDGTFLGVGCSDTYGASNNQDRNYLAPREEVNPYTGVWECMGSYFAGGPTHQDCVDRTPTSGFDAVEHRLSVADADLGNAGATYYYEADYIIRGDENLHNNWGSRACTMTQGATKWTFSTPNAGNALINGPALERWGDLRTAIDIATDDGQVMLAVQVTDLGGGVYHYEYALLNMNSNRKIRSFSIPVVGVTNITNIGFHDNDTDAANDWQVSVESGRIHWDTETFAANPNAAALQFGYVINFRFDANAAPTDLAATLGIFKPGTGTEVVGLTRGPINTALAVEDSRTAGAPRFTGIRPNPASRRTAIAFELAAPGEVRLEIYDATGRMVRRLVNENRAAGAQSAVWDGKSEEGSRAPTGVYYARLQTGSVTIARPLVRVK